MSQNIHCTPRIYIGDKEVGFNSFTINYPGNSQINRLQMVTSEFLDGFKFFNKEIKVYLNSLDGYPIFRGFIKSITYTYPDSSPWEFRKGQRVPKHIVAQMGYQVIHDSVPQLGTRFYGYMRS